MYMYKCMYTLHVIKCMYMYMYIHRTCNKIRVLVHVHVYIHCTCNKIHVLVHVRCICTVHVIIYILYSTDEQG